MIWGTCKLWFWHLQTVLGDVQGGYWIIFTSYELKLNIWLYFEKRKKNNPECLINSEPVWYKDTIYIYIIGHHTFWQHNYRISLTKPRGSYQHLLLQCIRFNDISVEGLILLKWQAIWGVSSKQSPIFDLLNHDWMTHTYPQIPHTSIKSLIKIIIKKLPWHWLQDTPNAKIELGMSPTW